jgi:anaerobic selenocysteine-containing dehydrogenase
MHRVVHRTCILCEACCGIEVEVEADRILGIRGDPLDPLSRGHVCAKAPALADLHGDPDRLRHPVGRASGGGWQRLSWREAFDRAAEGILAVQRAHGRDAAAIYMGEPVTHNLGALLFGSELVAALGTRHHFSANSLDQFPKQLASHWMYGSGLLFSVPDVDVTDYMLILGANPLVSNGSVMTAPGMRDRLRRIRERGGRIVVVDPVRSQTAELADEHHFIRPGTDALLLAALLHVVLAEKRARPGRVASFCTGMETLEGALTGFSPEAVADRTGLAAAAIRELAVAFSEAPSAVCYSRMGVSTGRFATVSSWLVELLNIATGNLDRPGGAMFPKPSVDVVSLEGRTSRGRFCSRTRGTPEFMGELPAATLAEEIETPGQGQVRALVTLAGNPALSSPAGHRLEAALEKLDFMVSIDFYLNETTRHAHVILPPVSPLEREHFDLAFQLLAVRNVPRWSPAVFDAPDGAPGDGEILLQLARRLRRGRGLSGRAAALVDGALLALGAERVARLAVDLGLRLGPHGSPLRPWRRGLTLARLRRAAHGLDLGPMEPCLPQRLQSKSKTIDLAPRELVAELERVRESLCEAPPEMLLVGRREERTLNSWSHNLPSLVKGPERCLLYLHPRDAAARGIEDGVAVTVTSRVGVVTVATRLTESVMPGVASLPHGYGHDRTGIGMRVAAEHPGASLNDLTDPAEIDSLSGNAVLNGIPVRVEPAAGW